MFGLVERAKNLAKQALNYVSSVVGGDDQTKPANSTKKKNNTSVMNPTGKTVAKPQDEFVKQNNQKNNTQKNNSQPVKQNSGTVKNTKAQKSTTVEKKVTNPQNSNNQKTTSKNVNENIVTGFDVYVKMTEIEKLVNKYGVSKEEFHNVVLPELGYSKKEFDKLSPAKQMTVLNTISGATRLYIIDKNKDNPNVDKAKLFALAARDFQKASEEGGVKSVNDFNKIGNYYINKLDREIKSAKNPNEKIQVITKNRIDLENSIKAERDVALKRCKTKAQRESVMKQYDARIEAFEGYVQTNYAANSRPEEAYISTYIRRGKDMADGTERAITIYNQKSMCCAAADSMTHERRIKQLKDYAECGDRISAQAYGAAVEVQTSYMSEQGLKQFEKSSYLFKQEYYKHKDQYNYITEEYLTKESIAIAVGITVNKNISSAAKAEMLKVWEEHAQQFSNYKAVKKGFEAELKQYMEKHPEAKQGIEDMKTKYREKYGSTSEVHTASNQKAVQKFSAVTKPNLSSSKTQTTSNNTSASQKDKPAKASAQQLEQALATSSFEDVREKYSLNSERDFAEVVLHSPKLKGHKQNIVSYIKRLSPEDLSDITRGCSTDMFLFVLRNISPDKAGHLYDLSKNDKCYAARKLGEKIIEEGQKNAAA